VKLLHSGSDECRVYVATTLSHLMGAVAPKVAPTFGNVAEKVALAIVAAGAIPLLVKLLRSGSDEGKTESALKVLFLSLINGGTTKAAVVAAGALPPLVELLSGGSNEVRANAVSFLSNLAFRNDANKAAIMKAGAIPPLVQLLRSGPDECRVYAATALSYLMGAVASEEGPQFCNVADRVAAAIVAAGAIPLLVELLRSGSDESKTESARVLQLLFSNGATNHDKKVIVAAGALPPLMELLQGRLHEGRKNAAFALYVLDELPGM